MNHALSACLQGLAMALENMLPSNAEILLFYIKTFSFNFGGVQLIN